MADKEECVSDVWKNGKNVQGEVKLDLVAHLKNANERPEATKMKNKGISLCDFDIIEEPNVLDIGCGIGSDVFRIVDVLKEKNKKGSIVGIDFNTEMIAASKHLVGEENIPDNVNVSFEQMDATSLIFDDESFDVIFISCVLQHISPENVVKVIQESKRVLKKDGRLVILEPEQSALKFYTQNKELSEMVEKMFKALTMAHSSVGSHLYWILREQGLHIDVIDSLSTVGCDLTISDPGWIKLNGMAKMAVGKGIFTQEEADKYVKLYSTAAEAKEILCTSLVFLYKASIPN